MNRILASTGILLAVAGVAVTKQEVPVLLPEIGVTADGSLEVGGTGSISDFTKPAFTIENEGKAITVSHSDFSPSAKKRVKDGKVEMAIGNRVHRFYNITNGFEYEIEYANRPNSNIETLTVEMPDNLEWVYQPPLTAQERTHIVQAENVIGSYAIYEKGSRAKFGHVYRPQLRDALGNTAWATMLFNTGSSTLTISMPSKWLDNAEYPVILDPTFGKTNIGANVDTMPADYIEVFGPYSPASNGTLTDLSMYTKISGVTFKLLVYGETAGHPGALLGKTGNMTSQTDNWVTQGVITPFAITAGTNYYIGNMQSTLITSKSDAGSSGYYKSGQTFGTEPDPFPAGYSTEGNLKSIYATYTATAAGSTFTPKMILIQ